ncbi:unnamed protein product [Rotaria sp. Silwood2]|nr:unnamed protein product [Rotaria sp. Silwood2]
MKPSSSIFILFVIASVISNSISNTDKCSGRWQVNDKLNIKFTLDWQILPEINLAVIEFRTNLVAKGFWYAFGFSSSLDKQIIGLVYALRWSENDTEPFWDIYNVTESNVIIIKENDTSLVTFQRSLSSGLLTVRPKIDLTSFIVEQQCLYFVYMRGLFSGDIPLLPDEILFNRSLCLTCQRLESISTNSNPTIEDMTTDLTIIQHTTIESDYDYTTENLRLFDENISTSTFFQSPLSNSRTAHHIKRVNDILEIDVLFERFSRPVNSDLLKQAKIDSTLHLLLGCIISISCFIIFITTILCLYGYYKCRRQEFRLFTERQTLKFKHDTNSYTWLGQQPSISSSSPYLIQSTSI